MNDIFELLPCRFSCTFDAISLVNFRRQTTSPAIRAKGCSSGLAIIFEQTCEEGSGHKRPKLKPR